MALSSTAAEASTSAELFSEFRHHIQELIQQRGFSNNEVIADLRSRGFPTSLTRLKLRLQAWGIRRAVGASGVRISGASDELVEAVNFIFHHTTLNDDAIAARILTDYGLQTTGRQVRSIRSRFKWLRRSKGPAKAAHTAATHHQVEQAILHGPGRTFGRRWLITWLRLHGFKAQQVDVANAQRLLDADGVTSRKPGLRKARLENYTTLGPNFLWCLDGHDKLAQYGMNIYAAVDAYSRKIIWFYCGASNRTAISVVNQYFNAVQATGICPRFIRTDRGTETVLLADLHFSFYVEAALREQWPEEDYELIRISDCYIYGPSTKNIRAEGLWRQQRFQCTGPWLDYFQALRSANLYREDLLADRVVVLFLFMPILREELTAFVRIHNAHPIRAQRNRSQHVPGVPDDLYQAGEQHGFAVNEEVLSAMQTTLPHHGIVFSMAE
jgi:hypothetical protein